MIDEKKKLLFIRQLKDIISQAERIIGGEQSSEEIENYSRYSNEFKIYISKNIDNSEILKLNSEIPIIDYRRNYFELWYIFLLPYWIVLIYQDYFAKRKTINEISISRNKYSSIEFISYSVLD